MWRNTSTEEILNGKLHFLCSVGHHFEFRISHSAKFMFTGIQKRILDPMKHK